MMGGGECRRQESCLLTNLIVVIIVARDEGKRGKRAHQNERVEKFKCVLFSAISLRHET